MTVRLNAYLNFRGEARDVLEWYRNVFGGELDITTFAEGGMDFDPSEAEFIMHGWLHTSDGFDLMAADVPSSMPLSAGSSISLSLSGDDGDALRRLWDALLEGGTLTVPLEVAPWGDAFGMLVDRWGVAWLVNISAAS
ncbi:VOC family protein [Protaetiibacter larvae]|uniref:VOC family protein n=1 Tax=Protaetiibacter larvae TaxID=2592654 RepID=A0A5C1YAM0_9MICO|nr:VOC family protein [Protaetiibacter larvae]QEO09942.1 VOC family protein [Protaetiibacter larvae]